MKLKILFIAILLFAGAFAFAADYNLLQPLPHTGQSVGDFPTYVGRIIPFILGLAAVLAVVMITIGGIEYAISEAVDAKADAKDRIIQAILGLLLALASWLILWTINPDLVNLKLNIKELPAGPACPPGQSSKFCAATEECKYNITDKEWTCYKPNILQPPPPQNIILPSQPPTNTALRPTTAAADFSNRKKMIVANGQFDKATEQKIQEALNRVYDIMPNNYKSLKKPVSILNRAAMDEVSKVAGVGTSRGFVAHNNKFVDGVFLLGDDVNKKNFYEVISGQKTRFETEFERTTIHELSHALTAEKFNNFDGDTEWRNLYETSKRENKGFALPELLSADLVSPYASVNPAEDMGTTVEAYVFTRGQYKTGDKRSDEILAQKFDWLEQNGFVKKMR
ncbi:MAG: hypothetical protein HYW15_00550 [Candidatus Giovannonibacteria bacterium]|nr:MAG: hypothetical protein HYW15_00550 [Candidatus Giovannonibacteria bacterium]